MSIVYIVSVCGEPNQNAHRCRALSLILCQALKLATIDLSTISGVCTMFSGVCVNDFHVKYYVYFIAVQIPLKIMKMFLQSN